MFRKLPCTLAALLLVSMALAADEKTAGQKSSADQPSNPALEKLKALEGEWIGTVVSDAKDASKDGAKAGSPGDKPAKDAGADKKADKPADKGGDGKPAKAEGDKAAGDKKESCQAEGEHDLNGKRIVYKVVGAGSAVAEDMFPGAAHEMITMYHADGKGMLTHYCAMGNQPQMKSAGLDGDKLIFRFAGGANIEPDKNSYMRDLTITFISPDHIQQEWQFYEDGKPVPEKTRFDLMRKKS